MVSSVPSAAGWSDFPVFPWLRPHLWRLHLKPVVLSHAEPQGEPGWPLPPLTDRLYPPMASFHSGRMRWHGWVSSKAPLRSKTRQHLPQSLSHRRCLMNFAAGTAWLCHCHCPCPPRPPLSSHPFDEALDEGDGGKL